jgi:RND family efflux transporter MFP subunit
MSVRQRALFLVLLWPLAMTAAAAEEDATLQWARKVALSTPVSGVIASVAVQAGDQVTKGQVLLRLDDRALRAKVQGLEAEQARATADRDEAKRELDRTQELYDRTLLADHDLQLAKNQLTAAEAALATTEAALTQARWKLEYSAVRTPFDARVLRCNAEPGQTVISRLQAEPLVEVVASEAMLARMNVSTDALKGLQTGQSVQVTVHGKKYAGLVQHIALEPGKDGRYAVDVRFQTSELLRAGLPAKVKLP